MARRDVGDEPSLGRLGVEDGGQLGFQLPLTAQPWSRVPSSVADVDRALARRRRRSGRCAPRCPRRGSRSARGRSEPAHDRRPGTAWAIPISGETESTRSMSNSSTKRLTASVRKNSSWGSAIRTRPSPFSGAARSQSSSNNPGAQRPERKLVWKTTASKGDAGQVARNLAQAEIEVKAAPVASSGAGCRGGR